MKKVVLLLFATTIANSFYAQTFTLTLQPDAITGTDAVLQSHNAAINYGTTSDFASWAWTFNSTPGDSKSLIKFDLSSIPAGATVNSAYLSLYHAYNTASAGQSGTNECYLQKVTSAWTENTVTWNTQPTVSTANQVLIPTSTSATQSYPGINVTALTHDAVTSPAAYYGWELTLLNFQLYRSMKLASSDNSDPAIRPKLVVTYTVNSNPGDSACVTLKPGPAAGTDAVIQSQQASSNFGTIADYAAWAWTFNSTVGYARGLLNFDLSSIPANATITSASLSLFYSYNTGNAGQSGTNDCYLERITSPWTESSVTWNTQPTTTSVNQVYLPASSNSSQSAPNINVTGIVQDIWANPTTSYGIEIRLVSEQTYRSMKYASSDNADPLLWPELTICYTAPSGVEESQQAQSWTVYPNPANTSLTVQMNDAGAEIREIRVMDLEGRIVLNQSVNAMNTNVILPVEHLANGIYFVQCVTESWMLNKKIIIAH